MPWKTYDEVLEGARKFVRESSMDKVEAIEFWFTNMPKIIQMGDIAVLHTIRKELENEFIYQNKE